MRHGSRRQGSEKAPPLDALRRHWSADELALYLRQPGQYAQGRGHSNAIARMISLTASLEVILTETETEALLLETNLIKP